MPSSIYYLALLAVALTCVSCSTFAVPNVNGNFFRPNWYGNCDATVNVTSSNGVISGAFTNGKLNGTTWWAQNTTGGFYTYFEQGTLLVCGTVPANVSLFSAGILQIDIAPYTGRCKPTPKATAYFLVQTNACNYMHKMAKSTTEEFPIAV